MRYDFKAAKYRLKQLKDYYFRLSKRQPQDGTWDWWLMREIEELEQEIREAEKKTAS